MPQPPRLFGGLARNRILIVLATRGPQQRRQLARIVQVDPQQTLETVRSLSKIGVISHHVGKPSTIELNQSFCVAVELRNLLHTIAGVKSYSCASRIKITAPDSNILGLFGKRSRTLLLLTLAKAEKPQSFAAIAEAGSLPMQSVITAANYLKRDEVISVYVQGNRSYASLNDSFGAMRELRQLLQALHVALEDMLK